MTTSVLAVPGIGRVDQAFLATLAAIADRHGWNIDGLAGTISHESGFNPAAHTPIPGQTATGLIQFIESTANALGTTTAALRRMTAIQQLSYVEKFFERALSRPPALPEDYLLATFGRADLIDAPDSYVVDRADSTDPNEAQRYRVNAVLDSSGKGYITVGDLRSSARHTLAAAHGARVQITGSPITAPTATTSTHTILTATAVIGMAAAAGYAAYRRRELIT